MIRVLQPKVGSNDDFQRRRNTKLDKHEKQWPEKSQKPEQSQKPDRKDLGTKGREHQVSGAMKQAAGEIEAKAGEMFGSGATQVEGTMRRSKVGLSRSFGNAERQIHNTFDLDTKSREHQARGAIKPGRRQCRE